MEQLPGLDWSGYFRSLGDDEARALVTRLVAEDLDVGEFMEIVDRAYALAPDRWHGPSQSFVADIGRPAATAYASRKRRFASLMAAFEDALVSGALPGEVAPDELQLAPGPPGARREVELLGTMDRLIRGEE